MAVQARALDACTNCRAKNARELAAALLAAADALEQAGAQNHSNRMRTALGPDTNPARAKTHADNAALHLESELDLQDRSPAAPAQTRINLARAAKTLGLATEALGNPTSPTNPPERRHPRRRRPRPRPPSTERRTAPYPHLPHPRAHDRARE